MNRSFRQFAAIAMLCTLLIPVVAQAEWVQKEIKWNISGVTGDGASIFVRDTAKVVFGGGTTTRDTTGWFSLKYAQPIPRGLGSAQAYPSATEEMGSPTAWGAAYQSDTTIAAYIVIQADSTAAPTATVTSVTIEVDGRVGAYGPSTTLTRGWVKQDSLVIDGGTNRGNLTLADESVVIPLRTVGVYGPIWKWDQLRVHETAATGVLSAARAFVRYWRPNGNPSDD